MNTRKQAIEIVGNLIETRISKEEKFIKGDVMKFYSEYIKATNADIFVKSIQDAKKLADHRSSWGFHGEVLCTCGVSQAIICEEDDYTIGICEACANNELI